MNFTHIFLSSGLWIEILIKKLENYGIATTLLE